VYLHMGSIAHVRTIPLQSSHGTCRLPADISRTSPLAGKLTVPCRRATGHQVVIVTGTLAVGSLAFPLGTPILAHLHNTVIFVGKSAVKELRPRPLGSLYSRLKQGLTRKRNMSLVVIVITSLQQPVITFCDIISTNIY
jgi:hypothetical protein